MILQGVALMIVGMLTVFFFLWLLVVSIQVSQGVIRSFETIFYKSDSSSPKPEIIAAIAAVLYDQQTIKR
jgi:sodium pump decarboxylase gamma subunit